MISKIACTVALLMLGWVAPGQAQQPAPADSNASIVANPAVERILRDPKQGEATVVLEGYVGLSTPETVRLYSDLTLQRYWDIPRNEIVRQVQGNDPEKDPIKLYVRSSTLVASASKMTAEIATMQRAMFDSSGKRSMRRTSSKSRFAGTGAMAGIEVCSGFCEVCALGAGAACLLCADCVLQPWPD
ncbi:hypothetical protein [Bradyrhizobium mercantei]|uniref:hypothetical protein n=1 Tax=Bradyrhizobium mercantei TaxID=1904807 RepID=UPI000977AF45|nr:hypothetical protein [Bradyrhizobium mercantei]